MGVASCQRRLSDSSEPSNSPSRESCSIEEDLSDEIQSPVQKDSKIKNQQRFDLYFLKSCFIVIFLKSYFAQNILLKILVLKNVTVKNISVKNFSVKKFYC